MALSYSKNQLRNLVDTLLEDFSNIVPEQHRQVDHAIITAMFELGLEDIDLDRPITTTPQIGENLANLGIETLSEAWEYMFYGFYEASVTVDPITPTQKGVSTSINLSGNIKKHPDDIINSARVVRDDIDETFVANIPNPGTGSGDFIISLPETKGGITYKVKLEVDNNGDPITVYSAPIPHEAILPIIYGYSESDNLEDDVYNSLSKLVTPDEVVQLSVTHEEPGYIYIWVPAESPLENIRNVAGFTLGAFLSNPVQLDIISQGLDTNWEESYLRYRSNYQSTINHNITIEL